MATVRRALVIGGGIGGMCAAIELRKRGVAVDLVEINPAWAVYGAGITISSPTLRALRSVGVLDEVLERGGRWSAIDLCAADGSIMNTMPMKPAIGAEDLPGAAGIYRPVLAEILSRRTRECGVQVRLGVSFESINQEGDAAEVRCTDGHTERYDLVIGADGLHSKVRATLFPDAPVPKFTGQGSWRTIGPRARENSSMFFGRTTKAGLNPVSAGESYLFLLDHREGADFIPAEQWPRLLAELLAEFGQGPVAEIRVAIEDGRIGAERIVYRPLFGLMTPAPWHRGRVVLLGDAVHATTPHLASGAGIAVEGALVLAQELERATGVDAALAAYAARCEPRARRVVESSIRLGELEQSGGSKDEHRALMFSTMNALTAPL